MNHPSFPSNPHTSCDFPNFHSPTSSSASATFVDSLLQPISEERSILLSLVPAPYFLINTIQSDYHTYPSTQLLLPRSLMITMLLQHNNQFLVLILTACQRYWKQLITPSLVHLALSTFILAHACGFPPTALIALVNTSLLLPPLCLKLYKTDLVISLCYSLLIYL